MIDQYDDDYDDDDDCYPNWLQLVLFWRQTSVTSYSNIIHGFLLTWKQKSTKYEKNHKRSILYIWNRRLGCIYAALQRASLMLTKLCELLMIQNCGLNREADDDDVHRYTIFICHLDLKINWYMIDTEIQIQRSSSWAIN